MTCNVPTEVVAALESGDAVTLRSATDASLLCAAPARTLQGRPQAGAVQFIEGETSASYVQLELAQGSPSRFVGQLDFASGQCPAWSAATAESCLDAGPLPDARTRDAAPDAPAGGPWLIGAVTDGKVHGADVAFCRSMVDMNELACVVSGFGCDPAQFSTPALGGGATEVSLVPGVEGPASAYQFSATERQNLSEGPAWTFFEPNAPEDFAFRALIKRPEPGQVGTSANPLCFLKLEIRNESSQARGHVYVCFTEVNELGGVLRVFGMEGADQLFWEETAYSCSAQADWGCFSIVFDNSAADGPILSVRYAGESLRPLFDASEVSLLSAAISAWGDESRSVVLDQLYWTNDDDSLYRCED